MLFFMKENPGPLGKLLIPGLRQGKYKKHLEQLLVPRNKNFSKNYRDVPKDTEANLKELPRVNSGTI